MCAAEASGGRLVSFIIEGDDFVSCEVCLENFDPQHRVPKLLPCGHNFCEKCLFSICCHQEYYFLDSINCPTCRATVPNLVARRAPTNYDLCRVLENVQKGREVNNVTVIHVPDPAGGTAKRMMIKSTDNLSPICRSLANKSTEAKHLRCNDCKRKLAQKHLAKVARYCEQCSSPTKMVYACLECCVNTHNGHPLLSVNQLEVNQLRTVSELRDLRKKILDVAEEFDSRADELRRRNRFFCSTLVNEKQNVLTRILASLDEAIRSVESSTLLMPARLTALRNEQLHNYAKMTKLISYLEKNVEEAATTRDQTAPSTINSLKTSSMTASTSTSSTCSLRQSRLHLRDDDSLSRESIRTLTSIMKSDSYSRQLAAVLQKMETSKTSVDERKQCYVRIAQLVTHILYEDITLSLIPLFAEALLNCFHQLNILSRKKSDGNTKEHITRYDIWKNVQFAYTELLKIAAKNYPAYHPERVDIVDDLAYLCNVFADVCDQATVTICMIEAARARAAESSLLTHEDRTRTEARLKLIDMHLVDCRRQQKIHALKSKSRTKQDGGLKRILTSCFQAQRVNS